MDTIWIEDKRIPDTTAGYSYKKFIEYVQTGPWNQLQPTGTIRYEYPAMSATETRGMSFIIDSANRSDATS